jgi:type VI secretion system protein ImpK
MPGSRNEMDATDYGRNAKAARSLADLCSEAFLLTFHIRSGEDPGHPDDVRKGVTALFRELEGKGTRAGYSDEDVKAAVYGLCALIDETILNSRWSFKDQWADRPLQLQYFGEHMAGERFFDLLERVRQKGQRKAELLEVFALILILGFQGKYKLRGREEVAKLTQAVVEESSSYRERASGLSPHWRIPDDPVEPTVRRIPTWVLVMFIVYRLMLSAQAADAANRMLL